VEPTLEHRFGDLTVHGTQGPSVQPKLRMGTKGDRYEREADRLADDSVAAVNKHETFPEMPVSPSIGTAAAPQAWALGNTTPVNTTTQSRIERLQRAGGEPLPEQVRAVVEPRLAHDFHDVRIHRNSAAHTVADDLQARALTVGNHIIFNDGQYRADDAVNSRLLAHELVHTVQQKHCFHPLIQRAPLVVNVGAPEEGLQSAPAEDLIKAGSDLDKRLHSLSRGIRRLLHDVFGEPGAPADEVWAELFPKAQFSEARRAAESYRAITNELSTRTLDIAFAVQWLDVAISTLNTLRTPLDEVAESRATQASIAKTLSRQARRAQHAAMRLRKHPTMARGSALAATARTGVLKRVRREQKEGEERERRDRRPGLLELSQKGPVDLLMLRLEAERSDPEFVEILNREIETTEAIQEGWISTHETPLPALEDRLGTLERLDRGDAARLITRMDQSDLTRLAENNRERAGQLGLRLAESTASQTVIGLVGTPLPFIGSPLADIVSERFEEKEAIRDLANAMRLAGGPSKRLSVPDLDRLTDLTITRSGERIKFRKSDRLHSLALLDAANAGSDEDEIPEQEDTFAPSDLVTLTVLGSNETVTLPAFAWLHAEDTGLESTYQEWAALLQQGSALAKASVRATGSTAGTEASGVSAAGRASSKRNVRPVQSPSATAPGVGVAPPRSTGSGGRGDGDLDDLFEAGETGGFKAEGPLVRVPSRRGPSQPPETARVLEVAAGRPRTRLGVPEEPRLLEVTRTDVRGTTPPSLHSGGLQYHDATKPMPKEFVGTFDTVIINNPRGFHIDIEKLGQALRPKGRIVIQGRGRVPTIGKRKQRPNPDFQRLLTQLKKRGVPPGYRIVEDETLPPTRFTEPAANILGEDFRYTTGEAMPGTGPNARIVIEKIGG
jgi:hypothetical protein